MQRARNFQLDFRVWILCMKPKEAGRSSERASERARRSEIIVKSVEKSIRKKYEAAENCEKQQIASAQADKKIFQQKKNSSFDISIKSIANGNIGAQRKAKKQKQLAIIKYNNKKTMSAHINVSNISELQHSVSNWKSLKVPVAAANGQKRKYAEFFLPLGNKNFTV